MKKMLCGIIILVGLLALSLYNATYFKNNIEILQDHVMKSSQLAQIGERSQGIEILEQAIGQWREMDAYTRVFIHHDGIDSVTDAFYEYLGALRSGDDDDTSARDRLMYHLEVVAAQEMPTWGSVF